MKKPKGWGYKTIGKEKMLKFRKAIRMARKAGVNKSILKEIKALGSWERFWAHKEAPCRACWFARYILNDRWPEAEPVIASDPIHAYLYALDIIRSRWPEAEPVIAKNLYYACLYARDIIKGRWPEAEAMIAKYPYYACLYACDVIKGRWPEAEAVIASDPYWNNLYNSYLEK